MFPTPLTLLCALLLTLPLAIVFTITTDLTTTTTTTIIPPPPPTPQSQKPNNKFMQQQIDDTTLFNLASRVNPNPSPAGSPKKLAFMFLTTGRLPLAPLWELYFNRTKKKHLYNIYIHYDDPNLVHNNNNNNNNLVFHGVFTNRTIPSQPTRRNTPTLAAAHRRLLAHALLHDPANYMFALLSPSCIPLHSFDFTYKTLINSKKSFIEILENEGGAWGRWAARGETVMLPEVKIEDFRIGSQFSVLTRQHARVVVGDTRVWSKFNLPCLWENRDRCYPEENYFPTLLSMVDRKGCVSATLTFVDWERGDYSHPYMFKASDVGPELIRELRKRRPRYGHEEINGSDASGLRRNDPFLFARKFGADTVGPLLEIAHDVVLRE